VLRHIVVEHRGKTNPVQPIDGFGNIHNFLTKASGVVVASYVCWGRASAGFYVSILNNMLYYKFDFPRYLLEKDVTGMKDLRTIGQASVVIIGSFNPAIFHPEWLDRNQVLPPQEVRDISEAKEEELEGLKGLKVKLLRTNVLVSGGQTRLSLPSYRISVDPEKFEAITSKREKYHELYQFIAATFKILEHTPITALGINFKCLLEFSEPGSVLMHRYFSGQPETISSIFGQNCLIDSKIRYDYKDAKVTLLLNANKESNKIDIDFNYHKEFTEKEGTRELTAYLLENYKAMMVETDKVIKGLFGEPVDGGKASEKSDEDNPS
jgi:hypothetical protein